MAGRSAAEREALAETGEKILTRFRAAGFEHIAPDILQPADIFLDKSGEDIRARTYVFTDPAGVELCLRPDLTVPACRYHLTHAGDPAAEARYCYRGPAFRFELGAADPVHAAEFDQAGLEWFAAADREAAEADVLALALAALDDAKTGSLTIRIGDLGLFRALIGGIAMPDRWRARLLHQFWRPHAFRDLLDLLSGRRSLARSHISPVIDSIEPLSPAAAERHVEALLTERGLPLDGGRSIAEITARLIGKAADRREPPLAAAAVARIERYLAIDGTPSEALVTLRELAAGDAAFSAVVTAFERRLTLLEERGISASSLRFSAEFGRSLEYYTGFVFQIEGAGQQLAGGGRYDSLLADIGAPVSIPAVGCAIHTEHLLALRGRS